MEPRWCVLPVPLLQAGATLAGAVRFELDRAGGARLPVLNELLQITSVACTASLEDPDSVTGSAGWSSITKIRDDTCAGLVEARGLELLAAVARLASRRGHISAEDWDCASYVFNRVYSAQGNSQGPHAGSLGGAKAS